MPNAYIEKLVQQGKGTKADLEDKWEKAKAAAQKAGQAKNYAYITSVFKKMAHASTADMVAAGFFTIDEIRERGRQYLEEHPELNLRTQEYQARLAADDAKDMICVDVPLFIRLLELARETIKTDVELHDVVERVISQSKAKDGPMTMEDYAVIWPTDNEAEASPIVARALARLKAA